jgi:hypothetical protein
MAIFAHTNAYVTINAVDVSDHVISAEWNESVDTVETVAMSDSDVTVKPTFKRGTFSVELQQDYATSNVYPTISAAIDANVPIAVEYRADAGTVSATNPTMQANAVVTEYAQGGPIGDIATTAFTWPLTGAVTRAVA